MFYVDDVSLVGPRPIPPPEFLTAVRANQHGYLPRAPKRATIAADVASPLAWTLFDAGDTAVASGTTTVFGTFTPSGEHLHVADFSAVRTPGTGYALEVYGERSHPFDIGDDVYDKLEDDALRYFFHNRAGIEIAMPFAEDAQWTRPAGHLSVAPNQGDLGVTCFNQTDSAGQPYSGCGYTLDVPKGWYDAGDHGKYVVNAGFAAWMLLNQYERTRHIPSALRDGHPDGSLNIPESGNGVPDVLDEARWEVEFMLAMQVPPGGQVEGVAVAGMAHHKLHDANWTGLGLPPHLDAQPRYLYPPTTAATLNLAAVAAQCARVWKRIDAAFADRCREAAETAWDAALAHPAMFARETFPGGGGYGDSDVSDEFYWAAAELFVTTGRPRYRSFLRRSPLFLGVPGTPDGNGVVYGRSMDWPLTQALGTISLAIVPNELPPARVRTARRNVVTVADGYLAARAREPYGIPYASDGGYLLGIELGRAGQHGHPRAGLRLHVRPAVPRRGQRRDGLHPRPQPEREVVRRGLRRAADAQPASPVLGAPGGPVVPAAGARRPGRRPQPAAGGPVRAGLLRRGLRAAGVLRGRHRVVLHQRSGHQLERAAGLDRGLPRRRAGSAQPRRGPLRAAGWPPAARGGDMDRSSARALTVAAVLAIAFAAPAGAQTVLFTDDFEDGNANGWTVFGGSWSVVTDGTRVYRQSSGSSRYRSGAGSTAWTNYSVEARVKPTTWNGTDRFAGLAARLRDRYNGYVLALRSSGRVEMLRIASGTSTALASRTFPVTLGTWYTLRIDAVGTTLRGYVNGALQFTATDGTFAAGLVGGATDYATASFDNFRVIEGGYRPATRRRRCRRARTRSS